ncbi:diguanylate cyclase [Vibrio profundi]|uniref:sensor domain-containing diguanylate cyclase n=1 Tax=Vibrio profundi TaxID=1774960 RepID=UPI00373675AF
MGSFRHKKHLSVFRLIYDRFLFSALIPLLVIELALLALYFSVTGFVEEKYQTTLEQEANTNLSLLTQKHIDTINVQLGEVHRIAHLIQSEQQKALNLPHSKLDNQTLPVLVQHANGSYFVEAQPQGTSYYYSGDTKIGTIHQQKVQRIQHVEALYKAIVDESDIIQQVYFNTWDNMNQLYPAIENVSDVYGPTINMRDYNFYYLADADNNPSREPVWTSVYLDPAGQGWLASCVVPIYSGDFLEGVSGIDITIGSFISDILALDLPWGASSFLVDESGVILAMPPEIEALTGLSELGSETYSEQGGKNVYKPQEFNVSNIPNTAFRQPLESFISSGDASSLIDVAGQRYLLLQGTVPVNGWQVMTLVDYELLTAPVTKLETLTTKIGYIAILIMALFYVGFYWHIKQQAKVLASKIAKPIENLTLLTEDTGQFLATARLSSSGINEVDDLGAHFYKLSKELEYRTRDLIETETRQQLTEEKANLLEKLSNTDHLTNLSNRMFLERLLDVEIRNFKASPRVISIILLDIDKFKLVNDRYGHDVGDEVLVEVASLLEENTRGVDTCGRWGGEEFLIVCPGTPIDNAFLLAEKIRVMFERHQFHDAFSCTASFGVAQLKLNESKHDWFKRVDQAMYKAKNSGRNQVVQAEELMS